MIVGRSTEPEGRRGGFLVGDEAGGPARTTLAFLIA